MACVHRFHGAALVDKKSIGSTHAWVASPLPTIFSFFQLASALWSLGASRSPAPCSSTEHATVAMAMDEHASADGKFPFNKRILLLITPPYSRFLRVAFSLPFSCIASYGSLSSLLFPKWTQAPPPDNMPT